jgi:hypothetical protein
VTAVGSMTIAVGSTTAVGSITMVGPVTAVGSITMVGPVGLATTVTMVDPDPVGPVGVIANTTLGAGEDHAVEPSGQRFFTPSTA